MALYMVWRKNPYFKMSTFVESFDGGVMQAEVRNEGTRAVVVRNTGVMVPFNTVKPFLLKVRKSGLDRRQL